MTDLDLVNQALDEMSQNHITSLDNTIQSRTIAAANIQLARVKRATLRVRDWNCARRRAVMAPLSADLALGEWSYAYRLPSDCLAARRFSSTYDDIKHAKFSVENDKDGKKVLFTNYGNEKLVYTIDLQDVNRWDPLLFDLCATRLAIQFAITFARDVKFLQTHWEVYRNKLEECVGVDESEGSFDDVYSRDLVTVRF